MVRTMPTSTIGSFGVAYPGLRTLRWLRVIFQAITNRGTARATQDTASHKPSPKSADKRPAPVSAARTEALPYILRKLLYVFIELQLPEQEQYGFPE